MKALTVIAATTYAIALWIFAPRSIWERELATAKRNRLTEPTPEQKPEPEPMPPTEPEPIIEIVEPTPEPEPSAQTVPTPNRKLYQKLYQSLYPNPNSLNSLYKHQRIRYIQTGLQRNSETKRKNVNSTGDRLLMVNGHPSKNLI